MYVIHNLIIVFVLCRLTRADTVQYRNQYVLKVKVTDIESVAKEVEAKFELSKQPGEIVPTIYEFERKSQAVTSDTADAVFLQKLRACCNGKVLAVEQVRQQTTSLWTPPSEPVDAVAGGDSNQNKLPLTTTYDDMGILKAWDRGYSGHGVTIAVTGVGIDTELEDLTPNVNKDLCYNAMLRTKDNVAPKQYPSYPQESLLYTDHENNCAGLAAAAKNDKCGDGVAYGASLVGVKTFNVKEMEWDKLDITETHVARGLGHAHDTVDIYSNSWSSVKDFGPDIGMAAKESIKRGIEHGRGGKGSVYVFPVGGINDGYTNSMYTITVNGAGNDGTIQPYTGHGACVLTSTYGEPSRNNTDLMTTSHTTHSQCISSFRGTSAATPIVAGIGALMLQANSTLTWRDVQHIIVQASDTADLEARNSFSRNGAGLFFHKQFGFGLLNASKALDLAETWTSVPQHRCVQVSVADQGCSIHPSKLEFKCDASMEMSRVGQVEHVTVVVSYKTPDEYNTNIVVVSPSNTTSVLMDYGQSGNKTSTDRTDVNFLSVNFWGEHVAGTWTVTLKHRHMGQSPETSVSLSSVSINICGTGAFTQTIHPPSPHVHEDTQQEERKGPGSATGAVLAMLYPIFVFIISGAVILYFYPPSAVYR